MTTTKPKAPANAANKNPLETASNPVSALFGDFKKSIQQDVLDPVASDFFKQLIDYDPLIHSGSTQQVEGGKRVDTEDMSPRQEITLFDLQKKEAPRNPNISAHIEYFRDIREGSKRSLQVENNDLRQTIEQIRVEIAQLISCAEILKVEYAEVSMMQTPRTPGKYHEAFFTWLLAVIKSARMKVEDGSAWLSTVNTKKSKKGYWGMFKKHGTTFGLSNERSVATQTG